jgi:hypothetical protein
MLQLSNDVALKLQYISLCENVLASKTILALFLYV